MTREKAMEILARRAAIHEESIKLEKEFGIFCQGTDTDREVHLTNKGFEEIIDALQPVVTYNPEWSTTGSKYTQASFTAELFGFNYKIFTLYKQEEEKQ